LCCNEAAGQSEAEANNAEVNYMIELIGEGKNATGSLSVLGTYHPLSPLLFKTDPFYTEETWNDAVISYRGQVFSNLRLSYDINTGILLMLHPKYGMPIKLQQDHVDWFDMSGMHFESIKKGDGFYEVLFSGESIRLYKKSIKKDVAEDKSGTSETRTSAFYRREDTYYLDYKGELQTVRKKRSYLQLFPEYKAAFRSYYRDRVRTVIKADLDEANRLMAEFFNRVIEK